MKPYLLLGILAGALGTAAYASDAKPKAETFDLSFAGGTPAELVEAISRASGAKPNVLVSPRLAKTVLPKMELHSVTVNSVFVALNLLTAVEGSARWTASENNVWVLQSRSVDRRTQIYYVGDLLQKFKIEDLNTAIAIAWKMDGNEAQAELKYHQDTQLLLARADERQLRLVTELLTELRRAVTPAPTAPSVTRPGEGPKAGLTTKP